MKFNYFAAVAALAAAVSPAQASTVDLFDLSGNFNQSSFSGTPQYAQTLTASGSLWEDLSFRISNSSGGGTFGLEIYGTRDAGLAGTGWAPDANSKLFSTILTHAGAGLETFSVNLNLAVTAGLGYAFVLNSYLDNDPSALGTLTDSTVRTTQYHGSDQYAGGEFIYAGTSKVTNSTIWYSRASASQDVAFQATFSGVAPVPLPAGLPLLMLALGGLGLAGYRQKQG